MNQNLCDVMLYHRRPEIKYIFHDLEDGPLHRWSADNSGAELKTFATDLETGGKRFFDHQQPPRLITVTNTLQHALIANLDPERSFLGNFIAILSYVTSGQRVNPNESYPSPAPPQRSSSRTHYFMGWGSGGWVI